MKLSVVMPVYNEESTILTILERVRATPYEKEIICVDDASTDRTWELLQRETAKGDLKLLRHEKNRGKGAAMATGLKEATGDIIIVQDADLEYDPEDYPVLLRPILSGRSQVVYGSRFLGEHKAMFFWHAVGNKLLTLITNVLYDTTLTDMETGYKVFTAEVASKVRLASERWGFDPEITARVLKLGYRIYEVPISYTGREHFEGKKIRWYHAVGIIWVLLKIRFGR